MPLCLKPTGAPVPEAHWCWGQRLPANCSSFCALALALALARVPQLALQSCHLLLQCVVLPQCSLLPIGQAGLCCRRIVQPAGKALVASWYPASPGRLPLW